MLFNLKKLAAILLTLLICFSTVGYYIVFKTSQLKVKSEIKKLIKNSVPEDQLVVFRLSPENQNDFEWLHSKEFRYKGNMYDIVRKTVISASETDLYCIHDVKETGLFAHLDFLVKEAMNHDKNASKARNLLSGFLSILYFQSDYVFDFFTHSTDIKFMEVAELYLSQSLSVILPPPRS